MRLGVLDIGSNTGHLLVVDAHRGAAPLPAYSYKQPLRLAEHLDEAGAVAPAGVDALSGFTAQALRVAEDKGSEDMLAFATSAVRDAVNSEAVLAEVRQRTGQDIAVLSGEDEVVDRLRFIRHAQTAGLTLAEIRQVLTISDGGEPPCGHVTDLIHRHRTDVEDRIRDLIETRSILDRLAERAADQDPTDCNGYCAILQPPDPSDACRPPPERKNL